MNRLQTISTVLMAIGVATFITVFSSHSDRMLEEDDARHQQYTQKLRDRADAQVCFRVAGFGSAPARNECGELTCGRHDGKGKPTVVAGGAR